jgi:hypothetical protein
MQEIMPMNAIRIETLLEGDTLYLPQLKPLVGKSVEILVTELAQQGQSPPVGRHDSPLAGSVLAYLDPFEPAASPNDWEASR